MNAEEIAIASKLLMYFIEGIYYNMPSAVAGSNCGHILYMPSAPRELNGVRYLEGDSRRDMRYLLTLCRTTHASRMVKYSILGSS